MAESTGGRLAGRTALITGAPRGIGAAVARRFAAEGAAVVLEYQQIPACRSVRSADRADARGTQRPGGYPARSRQAAAGPVDRIGPNLPAPGRTGPARTPHRFHFCPSRPPLESSGLHPVPDQGPVDSHGGDRAANNALWTIANNRMVHDVRTRGFAEKRRQQGDSRKDTPRVLTRYIARETFALIRAALRFEQSLTGVA